MYIKDRSILLFKQHFLVCAGKKIKGSKQKNIIIESNKGILSLGPPCKSSNFETGIGFSVPGPKTRFLRHSAGTPDLFFICMEFNSFAVICNNVLFQIVDRKKINESKWNRIERTTLNQQSKIMRQNLSHFVNLSFSL